MKTIIIYFAMLAICGYATSAEIQSRAGEDDMYEIMDLVPMENMTLLAQTYIENDAQYQELVAFLQSGEYAGIREEISLNAEWQELKEWVAAGSPIDIDNVLDSIIDMLLGGESFDSTRVDTQSSSTRTIQDYVDEATAMIPLDEVTFLILYKIQTSSEFAALYAYLSSHAMRALAEPVLEIAPIVEMLNKFADWGVDTDPMIQTLWNLFFGWGK